MLGVGATSHHWRPSVAAFAHDGRQGHAAQERHIQLVRRGLAAAHTKDIAGHVLDDAHDRHLQPLERGDPAHGIGQRHRLRRGDDDAAGQRYKLRQAHLRIARARRQIDHQIIQFITGLTPGHIGQQLLDRLVQHRSAPHQRFALGHQETDGHHQHAVCQGRHHLVAHDVGHLIYAHDDRYVGTVDVGIQQAHPRAHLPQRHGQIGRNGGLAHAALAACHGYDVLDGHIEFAGDAVVGAHLRIEFHLDTLHARQSLHSRPCLALDLTTQWTGRRG